MPKGHRNDGIAAFLPRNTASHALTAMIQRSICGSTGERVAALELLKGPGRGCSRATPLEAAAVRRGNERQNDRDGFAKHKTVGM